MKPKLYLDEDIFFASDIAVEMRREGYDVISTHDAGRAGSGITDAEQIVFAKAEQRVLVSFNIRDFVAITNHHGILLAEQLNFPPPPRLLIRALRKFCDKVASVDCPEHVYRLESFR